MDSGFSNSRPMSFKSQSAYNPYNYHRTPSTNAAQYDANGNINILSQPASVPFPSDFNPELLKQFPLPPPLPPANFAVAHGVVPFGSFPQNIGTPPRPLQPQNVSNFSQSINPLVRNSSDSTQNIAPAQDPRLYNQVPQSDEANFPNGRIHTLNVSGTGPAVVAPSIRPSTVHAHEAATYDTEPTRRNGYNATNTPSSSHPTNKTLENLSQLPDSSRHVNFGHVETGQDLRDSNPASTSVLPSELRERAKAALLSLVPHNIHYGDLLTEGIQAGVLQQLYAELGLNWYSQSNGQPKDVVDEATESAQEENSARTNMLKPTPLDAPSKAKSPLSTSAAVSSATAPISKPSMVVNPNLERKDRIAQLLAAKAGRTTTGTVSQSQSPTPNTDPVEPRAQGFGSATPPTATSLTSSGRNAVQAELVREKMEQLKKENMPVAQISEQDGAAGVNRTAEDHHEAVQTTTSAVAQAMSLPTPVREQLAQSGYTSLIPGLFMTSAEMDDLGLQSRSNIQSPSRTGETSNQVQLTGDLDTSQQSRKRARSIQDDDTAHTDSKRHASQAKEPADVDMIVDNGNKHAEEQEGDTASEGEIVEDEADYKAAYVSSSNVPHVTLQEPKISHGFNAKQTGIDTTRRRIAEMEQRQGAGRNQSLGSSPSGSALATPTIPQAPQMFFGSPLSRASEQTSVPRPNEAAGHSPVTLVKATQEQIAERAAQLKADFLRQRALRQRQLQEGIPALNSEVVKNRDQLQDSRSKLAQLRMEIQQFEARIKRARENEQDTILEIERLERQISDGVSGQKQFSTELSQIKQQTKIDDNEDARPQEPVPPQPSTSLQSTDMVAKIPDHRTETPQADFLSPSQKMLSEAKSLDDNMSHHVIAELPSLEEPSPKQVFAPRIHGPELEDAIIANGKEHSSEEAHTEYETSNSNNTKASDDSEQSMEESVDGSDDSPMSIDNDSEDSASMSDSGSEEYEPADPESSRRPKEMMEPEAEGSPQSAAAAEEADEEEEGEDYEPAEVLDTTDRSGFRSTPNAREPSPVPSNLHSDQDANSSGIDSSPQAVSQVSATAPEPKNDDREGGLQLSEADTLTRMQESQSRLDTPASQVLGAEDSSAPHFKPYQSPLNSFKSYRFHPFFNEQVKDGYRSLTYSHNIDSKVPICLTELNGGTCTDPECQDQHFGSMALTDDKILVQMSSANDIKDKGLRDQYLLGLKQVIARLRQQAVKDFVAVADALSQYRREWAAAQLNS